MRKLISWVLLLVICFTSVIGPTTVYAAESPSAASKQASFLSFMGSSDEMVLQTKDLTSQDYYVLAAFMSNWFEPGKTTLKDLVDPSNAATFYNDFASAMGKSSNEYLKTVVSDLGNDIFKGINSGVCTIVDSSGKPVTGKQFIDAMKNAIKVSYSDEEMLGSLQSSILYYEKNGNIAFDFSSNAMKAAFQTVLAYNPDLFLVNEGISSASILFLDSIGNLWAAKSVKDGYDINNEYNKGNYFDTSHLEQIYLILPACLNPSTFSPNVGTQAELRVPMMNRFVLGSLLDAKDLMKSGDVEPTFSTELVPFYNAISKSSDTVRNRILNVFGVNSLSPYLMNTDAIAENTWTTAERKQDFANFVYNKNGISISKDVTNGIGKYGTNSYIVFSMNMGAITHNNSDQYNAATQNFLIDLEEGIFWGKKKAFTVLDGNIDAQKQLFLYLFSPTILHLNQVSMSFYALDSAPSSSDDLSVRYSSILTETENTAISKMGARGFSLFLDTMYEEDKGNDKYLYTTPQRMFDSFMIKKLLNVEEAFEEDTYNSILSGGLLPDSQIRNTVLNSLFRADSEFSSATVESMDKLIGHLDSLGCLLPFTKLEDSRSTKYAFKIHPRGMGNVGNKNKDIVVGRTLGLRDTVIRAAIQSKTTSLNSNAETIDELFFAYFPVSGSTVDYITTLYCYSIFTPSDVFLSVLNNNGYTTPNSLSVLGVEAPNNTTSTMNLCGMSNNGSFMSGVYFGYIIDMVGITTCSEDGFLPGKFSSKFLPKYTISAQGGDMSYNNGNGDTTGVTNPENVSFEQLQKDLIRRIAALTTDGQNDYRNSLIKNILDGVVLTLHRTIVGTWNTHVDSIATGGNSTYQSVTGYIYTPTLEELSFTSTIMDNYVKIYAICMLIIFILLLMMVVLNMRTWQQGLLLFLTMAVFMLTPYILISNSVNISNKFADSVYSDRFDFWAINGHQRSLNALSNTVTINDLDEWLLITSAESSGNTNSSDSSNTNGVRVKWMSPKKVDMFQSLYSDKSLSDSFVTNMEIFKWLFSNVIYDSEYVESNGMGTYLYRSYNTIALEAESYYQWGQTLVNTTEFSTESEVEVDGLNYHNVPMGYKDMVDAFESSSLKGMDGKVFIGGLSRLDKSFYSNNHYGLMWTDEKLEDLEKVSQYTTINRDKADKVGLWGSMSTEVTEQIVSGDYENRVSPGIISNLPNNSVSGDVFNGKPGSEISKAIYLKNTESPFYYFYSVLKSRYAEGMGMNFKDAILEPSVYKVVSPAENPINFNTNKNVKNAYRDFLDLEGLFEYVIPTLKAGNDYVDGWQKVNGTDVDDYDFEYEIDINGDAVAKDETYQKQVQFKNAHNRVWNMYCPWVDSLYDLGIKERVEVGRSNIYISDTLNPSSYIQNGRPMIFSEADMIIKGYTYKDLTDIERRIQAVLESTYEDMLYLVNYYDMDDETLICVAAMYATFNFNTEFSQGSFLGESIMLYPQGFELRNFNYDAFMRLALLNATGENIFDSTDLYTRVMNKGSLITGILLVVADIVACILIPLVKFIILLGLFLLGILIGIACIVNPPDKVVDTVVKSLVVPTLLFMALNMVFALCMSFIVGEGLTAYVGNKGMNFVTNDPTITIFMMSLGGFAYVFVGYKIIKFLFEAYKKFGMSTFFATLGIVSATVAHGARGIANATGKIAGSSVGAGIGALTAGSGNRLSGAYEGARAGASGIVDRRIADKRRGQALSKAMQLADGRPSNASVTDSINAKASGKTGSGTKNNGSGGSLGVGSGKGSSFGSGKNGSNGGVGPVGLGTPTKDKPKENKGLKDKFVFENTEKDNLLGKGISGMVYGGYRVADTLSGASYGLKKVGHVARNVSNYKAHYSKVVGDSIKKVPGAVGDSVKAGAKAVSDNVKTGAKAVGKATWGYIDTGTNAAVDNAFKYHETFSARNKERAKRYADFEDRQAPKINSGKINRLSMAAKKTLKTEPKIKKP